MLKYGIWNILAHKLMSSDI